MSDTATKPADMPTEVRAELGKQQRRHMVAERATVDAEARTVELAFASDAPYERWWGVEILDMSPASVDLSRLNARHPLLLNHDPAEQIGVVEQAWVDADRKARARVRFSRSALATEILQDVQDGIRELVSVGYTIDDMVLEQHTDAADTYRVKKWTPYEVSIVSIPADPSVGVGRSLAAEAQPAPRKDTIVSDTTTAAPAATQQPDIRVIETRAAADERQRGIEIRAMGKAHNMGEVAERAVADGVTVDAFRKTVLEGLQASGAIRPATKPEIGMSEKEVKRYSVTKLMRALLDPQDREAQRDAGLEIEASVAARKLSPVDEQGRFGVERAAGYRIPLDVLGAPQVHDRAAAEMVARALMGRMQQRDLSVGTNSAGGYLVAEQLLAGSFIDLLRKRMVLADLGATMLDGLVGNIAIPSQSGGASTYWVTEGTAVTESAATFGQVAMTPKTVGMFTDYSRKTLLQTTPAIEGLVRADLARGIGVEIDRVGLAGDSASDEPDGIINTSGIGSVAGGTNGAAPTYAHMVSLEEQVGIGNADMGALAYVTNAKMRAQLKLTQQFSSTNGVPVWNGNEVNGYRAAVTNNCPSTLTKGTASGTCSAIVFGNFNDLLMGFWGGLDIILDPSALATSGGRRIVALQDVDVAVRHAASFAAMLDALRT